MKYLPVVGIVIAFIFLCSLSGIASIIGSQNSALRYDQTVQEQESVVNAQLQRRHDLILSLVSTVDASGRFEKSTLTEVIKMRQSAKTGNVDQAMLSVNALTEAYPEIKTTQAYVQLMTELAITENIIVEQRKAFNSSVRSYQMFTKSFPTRFYLSISGYQVKDYKYLEFSTPQYSPDIFKDVR